MESIDTHELHGFRDIHGKLLISAACMTRMNNIILDSMDSNFSVSMDSTDIQEFDGYPHFPYILRLIDIDSIACIECELCNTYIDFRRFVDLVHVQATLIGLFMESGGSPKIRNGP